MFDIFISYSSTDREKAREIARLLEQRSYSVFWDRNLLPGDSWEERIEDALNTSKVVIVLWSNASVKSDWVKSEAGDGAERRILIPALIEGTSIPLRYRSIHAADLTKWTPGKESTELNNLLNSVDTLIRKGAQDAGGNMVEHPEPVQGAENTAIPALPASVSKPLVFHLLLGTGLFYLDAGVKRKWLYVVFPVYALVSLLLALADVNPFNTLAFGFTGFAIALVLYGLSFFDVALTYFRLQKR